MTQWSESNLSGHFTTTDAQYPSLNEDNSNVRDISENKFESLYVHRHLDKILPRCLAEVIERRPLDPIEYIAQWIYKNRQNEIEAKEVRREKQMQFVLVALASSIKGPPFYYIMVSA